MRSALKIVETLLGSWRDDPAGCMATLMAPDVVYTLNVSSQALPLGGETRGLEAVSAKLLGVRVVFDYLIYRPCVLGVHGEEVRARIDFTLRHKLSGEKLTGQMRSVYRVRDGRVVRIDEYADAPLIESFMRMVSQSAE